jgi:hypothetical protein
MDDMWNNPGLAALGRSMNNELAAKSKMKVGAVLMHPDGYKVKVIEGAFLRNGRVSNFWSWQRVNDDGTLGPKESGYGW